MVTLPAKVFIWLVHAMSFGVEQDDHLELLDDLIAFMGIWHFHVLYFVYE